MLKASSFTLNRLQYSFKVPAKWDGGSGKTEMERTHSRYSKCGGICGVLQGLETKHTNWWFTFPDFQVHLPVRVRIRRKCVSESFLQVRSSCESMFTKVSHCTSLFEILIWSSGIPFRTGTAFFTRSSNSVKSVIRFCTVKTGVPVFKVL